MNEQSPNAHACHPSRADSEGLAVGDRSHKVRWRNAGELCEVLRFAQDDTLWMS
jgi:hypothetical protein